MPQLTQQDSQGRWIYPIDPVLSALCTAADYSVMPLKTDCDALCDPKECPDCPNDTIFKYPLVLGDPIYIQTTFPDFFNENIQEPEIGWNDGSGGAYWLDACLVDVNGNPIPGAENVYLFATNYLHGWSGKRSYQNLHIDTSTDEFAALVANYPCFFVEIKVCSPYSPTFELADTCAETFGTLPDGTNIGDLAMTENGSGEVFVYQWNGAAWVAYTGSELVYAPCFNAWALYNGVDDWDKQPNPTLNFEFDELCCDLQGSFYEPPSGLSTVATEDEYMVYEGILYQMDEFGNWEEVVTLPDETIICFPEIPVMWANDTDKLTTRLPSECYTCPETQSCFYGQYEIQAQCKDTVTLEGIFTGEDCQGFFYGLPLQRGYVGSKRFNYRNFLRVYGSFETQAFPRIEEDSDNRDRINTILNQQSLLRTWGLPELVAYHIANIFMSEPNQLFVDGEPWEKASDIEKNNDNSSEWWLEITVERELCERGNVCDDQTDFGAIPEADDDVVIDPGPK